MIVQGRLLIDPGSGPEPGWIEIEGPRITRVETGAPPGAVDAGHASAIVCPGFLDAHLHLPQFGVVGCDGLDLLGWLAQVIYPAERQWADPARAAAAIDHAQHALLRAGTLGYAGFLTSHEHVQGTTCAAHAGLPLRAALGRALMDRNAPPDLLDGAPADLPPAGFPSSASPDPRLELTVNPRFAVSCSESLLGEAGRAARASGAMIQTHLAEQVAECDLVRSLFPDAPHYAAVYDEAGLLGPRTLLAHCVHLATEEWTLIAERGAVAVHCPTANTFLRSGLFNLDAAREHGVRLALGSDIAAGVDIAMPRVARAMIDVAKTRSLTATTPTHIPEPAEAWRLITRGNADALGFADAGRLEVGAVADLLVLDPPFDVDEHLIGRLVYTWSDDYILARLLAGRLVEPGLLP